MTVVILLIFALSASPDRTPDELTGRYPIPLQKGQAAPWSGDLFPVKLSVEATWLKENHDRIISTINEAHKAELAEVKLHFRNLMKMQDEQCKKAIGTIAGPAAPECGGWCKVRWAVGGVGVGLAIAGGVWIWRSP